MLFMSIKVEYYGYLKDIFGSIDIINYSSLKEKSIYNLLKNIKASKNILLDNN